MLVDFEVENFRSYRDAQRLSMVASSAKELPENLIDTGLGFQVVRSAVLYGPNASGKSNLLQAMDRVGALLEFPVSRLPMSWTALPPFALGQESSKQPSRFRVRFLVEGVLYDYSISVRPWNVEEERLVAHPHGRPQEWFHRRGKAVEFNATYLKGPKQSLRGMTPAEAPLLAVAAAFGHAQLSPPARWLANNLCDRLNLCRLGAWFRSQWASLSEVTARVCHEDPSFHSWVNALLRHADLGIQDVQIEWRAEKSRPVAQDASDGLRVKPANEATEQHPVPWFFHSGDPGVTTRFGLADESHGTQRLFNMLVPLYEVLRQGQLAVFDELGASLHPSLVREIIRAFHDPELNPRGAQLVFATHDTSLLSGNLFRRDQVWFTEKDPGGATDLYSLQDVRGIRDDEPFQKGYLRGRYGAIPFFGQFDFPPVAEEPAEAAT